MKQNWEQTRLIQLPVTRSALTASLHPLSGMLPSALGWQFVPGVGAASSPSTICTICLGWEGTPRKLFIRYPSYSFISYSRHKCWRDFYILMVKGFILYLSVIVSAYSSLTGGHLGYGCVSSLKQICSKKLCGETGRSWHSRDRNHEKIMSVIRIILQLYTGRICGNILLIASVNRLAWDCSCQNPVGLACFLGSQQQRNEQRVTFCFSHFAGHALTVCPHNSGHDKITTTNGLK